MKLLIIVLMLTLTGCASHELTDAGNFTRSFETNNVFYTQFEIHQTVLFKDGEREVVYPFSGGNERDLPLGTTGLYMGLYVENPHKMPLSVISTYEYCDPDTGEIYRERKKPTAMRGLMNERFSVDLPIFSERKARMRFMAEVVNSEGGILYREMMTYNMLEVGLGK